MITTSANSILITTPPPQKKRGGIRSLLLPTPVSVHPNFNSELHIHSDCHKMKIALEVEVE